MVHKLITYLLATVVINYIFTIGFYETDAFYMMVEFAYSCTTVQVWAFNPGINILIPNSYFVFFFLITQTQSFVLHIVLYDILRLFEVFRAIESILIANSKPNQRHFALCEQYAKWMAIIVRVPMITFPYLVGIITIPFMIKSYVSGSMRPCMFVYFIGIENYSSVLLIILHAYNYVMLWQVCLTVVCVDTLVFMTFLSLMFLSSHFEAEVSVFVDDSAGGELTSNDMKMRLRKIIFMHRNYVE